MRVKVYYNLHRNCFSVLARNAVGSWTVIAYMDHVELNDCFFYVSEAGRQRVIREGRKNVHAYVIGTIVRDAAWPCGRRVRYNPYKYDSFMVHTFDGRDERIDHASCAILDKKTICVN